MSNSLDFDEWWASHRDDIMYAINQIPENEEYFKSLFKQAYDAGYDIGYQDC